MYIACYVVRADSAIRRALIDKLRDLVPAHLQYLIGHAGTLSVSSTSACFAIPVHNDEPNARAWRTRELGERTDDGRTERRSPVPFRPAPDPGAGPGRNNLPQHLHLRRHPRTMRPSCEGNIIGLSGVVVVIRCVTKTKSALTAYGVTSDYLAASFRQAGRNCLAAHARQTHPPKPSPNTGRCRSPSVVYLRVESRNRPVPAAIRYPRY
jgi:hypothetical protein